MPRKSETKLPEKTVAKAVKRHLEGGVSVISLAEEYGVSRATVYNWVSAFQDNLLESAKTQGMGDQALEHHDKRVLIAQIKELRTENAALRQKVVTMMLKYKEI